MNLPRVEGLDKSRDSADLHQTGHSIPSTDKIMLAIPQGLPDLDQLRRIAAAGGFFHQLPEKTWPIVEIVTSDPLQVGIALRRWRLQIKWWVLAL
jgi:hypothetical protein